MSKLANYFWNEGSGLDRCLHVHSSSEKHARLNRVRSKFTSRHALSIRLFHAMATVFAADCTTTHEATETHGSHTLTSFQEKLVSEIGAQ